MRSRPRLCTVGTGVCEAARCVACTHVIEEEHRAERLEQRPQILYILVRTLPLSAIAVVAAAATASDIVRSSTRSLLVIPTTDMEMRPPEPVPPRRPLSPTQLFECALVSPAAQRPVTADQSSHLAAGTAI